MAWARTPNTAYKWKLARLLGMLFFFWINAITMFPLAPHITFLEHRKNGLQRLLIHKCLLHLLCARKQAQNEHDQLLWWRDLQVGEENKTNKSIIITINSYFMPGPNVKCFLSISSLNMHRNPLRNKCIVNSSHYMNEETEKFSSLPGKWALDIDYLTSGPLTPPLTLRRTECEGRGGLERWQSRMSCVWSKGNK